MSHARTAGDAAGYLGRYAPSPTGDLHLGNALAAVCAWARARRAGGVCLLRVEDLDAPRVVPGAMARNLADLEALGLRFGATGAGAPSAPVLVQSADLTRYQAALDTLRAAGLLYACRCSRRDLAHLASAPHLGDDGPAYPGTCRDLALPFDDPSLPVAWRLRVPAGVIVVDDRLQGSFHQDVAQEVGDFVLRRKDGVFSYQLAVVVDDAWQGVTEVVRGADLLSSSPRQVVLHQALGHTPPAFAHIPLWLDADGGRIAKRSGASPHILRALFARGVSPGHVLGIIGAALGVCAPGEATDAETLAARLDDAVLMRRTLPPP